MSHEIPWRQTLGAKLGGITLGLGALALLLVLGNLYTLASLRGDAASMALFAKGRMYCFKILYLADRLGDPREQDHPRVRDELLETIREMDLRYVALEQGDPDQGIAPQTD